MFKKLFSTGLATIALGMGLAVAAPVSANAGNVQLEIQIGGHGDRYRSGHRQRDFHRSPSPRHHYQRRHYSRGICHPGEAVHKASRHGIRHARIERVGHRYIIVAGRKYGGRVNVGYHRNSPHCSVAWVKRSHRHGYRY